MREAGEAEAVAEVVTVAGGWCGGWAEDGVVGDDEDELAEVGEGPLPFVAAVEAGAAGLGTEETGVSVTFFPQE